MLYSNFVFLKPCRRSSKRHSRHSPNDLSRCVVRPCSVDVSALSVGAACSTAKVVATCVTARDRSDRTALQASISLSCWPRAVSASLKTVNNIDTAHTYSPKNARFFIRDLLSLTPLLLSWIEL